MKKNTALVVLPTTKRHLEMVIIPACKRLKREYKTHLLWLMEIKAPVEMVMQSQRMVKHYTRQLNHFKQMAATL